MAEPRLRFKKKASVSLQKLEQVSLSEVSERIGDGIHTTPKYDDSGEFFFINGNNLVDGRIQVSESTKRINRYEFEKHKTNLNGSSILLSINGTIGNLAFYNGEDVVLGKSACYINLKNDTDKNYIYYLLQSPGIKRYFDRELTGSTIRNLSLTTIKATKFLCPEPVEMAKVGGFLSKIDQKIFLLTQKHELLIQYKKGAMQKIFNQEIKFRDKGGKDFPGWKSMSLAELGDTYNGLTGKTADDFGVGANYVTYKQIFDSSRIDASKFGCVSIKSGERQNMARYGDLFFTTSSETPNEVGYCSVLLEDVKNLYLNSFCFGYRIKSFEVLLPKFARFIFFSSKVRESIVLLAQGSTRYNISKTNFMKIKVLVPALKEQEKISLFLESLEGKIAAVASQLELTKQYKQGLLQQMFI